MEWSIQQIARLTGSTSRTLRHYDDIGLLPPSRVGNNGYRYYDQRALVRLQRILLLRELGLGLPRIADVLASDVSPVHALETHLAWLVDERNRLERQMKAVASTIRSLEEGRELMAEDMFDGFDHARHREEVEERWGRDAYARSDAWWRGMSDAERAAWKDRSARLGADWMALAASGADPASDAAQELARRHVEWLRGIPGTPSATPGGGEKAYVVGLAEMYVADERFAANYGGAQGAAFVRDALARYAEAHL